MTLWKWQTHQIRCGRHSTVSYITPHFYSACSYVVKTACAWHYSDWYSLAVEYMIVSVLLYPRLKYQQQTTNV